jgi:putative addiction module component (TIGR02574 family)
MNLQAVITEVESWPMEDRLQLIEELWDRIATAPEVAVLTDHQKQDLQRRLDAFRDNPKAGSPWEEVRARLQRNAR